MLEIIVTKQVDIYISIATSIFGVVLGFVLNYLFAPPAVNSRHTTNVVQAVTINNIKNNAKDISKFTQADNRAVMVLGGLFLFFGLTAYLFFRTEILYALLYSGILLLSMWVGAVLRAYFFGGFKGFSWLAYLFYVAAFLGAYFIVIQLAFTPIYTPQNFQYAEEIINRSGWSGIRNYFTMEDLFWAGLHLMGIFFLLLVFWQVSLSLLHMLVSGRYIASDSLENQPWIVRKTAKYCNPWVNIIVFSLLVFLAGSMVSGLFLYWIQNEIPIYIEEIFNIIMHGRS